MMANVTSELEKAAKALYILQAAQFEWCCAVPERYDIAVMAGSALVIHSPKQKDLRRMFSSLFLGLFVQPRVRIPWRPRLASSTKNVIFSFSRHFDFSHARWLSVCARAVICIEHRSS